MAWTALPCQQLHLRLSESLLPYNFVVGSCHPHMLGTTLLETH